MTAQSQEIADDLTAALAPMVTNTWPLEKSLTLCRLWRAGETTAEIGDRLRITKYAVIHRAHRLIAAGILLPRPSPILPNRGISRPDIRSLAPGVRTLPPLPSELAS